MIGFLVMNEEGYYLSSTYFWAIKDNCKDAYVHSLDALRGLNWANWASKPTKFYKAEYDPENGVNPLATKLDLDEFKDFLALTDPCRKANAITDITVETEQLTDSQYLKVMSEIEDFIRGVDGVFDVMVSVGQEMY
ncbi:MAG: hypothetical protein AAGA46_00380 [Cyanobacteria bacterium P01_F01_bin.13]